MNWYRFFQIIADRPLSHISVDEIHVGYRRAIYKSDSIYYKLEGMGVEIMHILGRQDL